MVDSQSVGGNGPVVSVIMPAYNAEKYIKEAIQSVRAQSRTDWELIVVDDGSCDRTPEIVREFAVQDSRIKQIVNEKNVGVAESRNRALSVCRGQYVAFLDSDDVWRPQKLEKQIACADQIGADIICTSYGMMDGNGARVFGDFLVPCRIDYQKMLYTNVIGCLTVLIKKDVMTKYGFRSDYFHEDYVAWITMLRDGHTAVGLREVLADYRVLPTSRSFHKWNSAKNRWAIYRSHLRLSRGKSVYCLSRYMLGGLRKYRKRGGAPSW